MIQISKYSDLEIEVIFKDKTTGLEIPVPVYDFELSYYVSVERMRTATQVNKVLSPNCRIVDGRLHIYLDAPTLGGGLLRTRHKLSIPNANFPDRLRTTVREGCLEVMLVENPCCYSADPVLVNDVIAEEYSFIETLSGEDESIILTDDGYEILIDKDNGRRSN